MGIFETNSRACNAVIWIHANYMEIYNIVNL